VADLVGHRLNDSNRNTLVEALRKVGLALGVNEDEAAVLVRQRHPVAYRELVCSITVNETYFFRHPEHWELLQRMASAHSANGRAYRSAWSVGCSTGEEAYTLAMVLSAFNPDVRVAASDISAEALEVARVARYGSWSFRDRGPERVPGMVAVGRQWEVAPRFRALVSFHEQNFADDPLLPPPSIPQKVDVIFCRNVLLYLKPARAAAVRRWLCEALAEDGVLVLGALEGPDKAPEGFSLTTQANACTLRRLQPVAPKIAPPPTRPAVAMMPAAVHKPQSVRARVVERMLDDARALADRGEFDEALARTQPFHDEPDALYLSATVHAERGQIARAEVLLRQVLLLSPSFVPAYLHLALITTRSGDLAGTAHYRAALVRLLEGRRDDDEVGIAGMKVAYVRQVLGSLGPE
jgi:chemotaxis protein methyltransferase CheR